LVLEVDPDEEINLFSRRPNALSSSHDSSRILLARSEGGESAAASHGAPGTDRHMRKLALALLGLLLASPASAQAPLTLSVPSPANGSAAMIGKIQWQVESASRPWSVTNVNPTTLRFELRAGDVRPGEYSTNVERVEIDQGNSPFYPGGQPFTTQFDLNILPGSPNTADWVVLYQLAYPYKGPGVWGASPDVALGMNGERLTITAHRGTGDCMSGTTQLQINWPNGLWLDPLPVQRGTTHTFKITMMFDANDGNGTVQAWRDGFQIVNYSGKLGCDRYRSHQQSFGIYRRRAPETLATTIGNIYLIKGGA
jgi:hypothetical protein